jgi:dihydrofolate reductase/thymidylate synthase
MNIIVAFQAKDRGIGKDNDMPWRITEDLKYFKDTTTKCPHKDTINIVFMGRKTWESIPLKHRALNDRICYVVSRNTSPELREQVESYENTKLVNCFDETLMFAENIHHSQVWIIGGSELYNHVIDSFNLENIYVTEFYTDKGEEYECTTHFPKIDLDEFSLVEVGDIKSTICKKTQKNVYYRHLVWTNDEFIESSDLLWQSPEIQYLNGLKTILNDGIESDDRTGVGTLSKFGMRFEYDLGEGFPLLTTKRIFVRAVFEELMLYLRGQTDNKILIEKGIHIWDGNTSKEFLAKRNLSHYPEGDMGETYGFNFRHFGGTYVNCETKYDGNNGFDQLAYVIDLIKNDPKSRRIIINLWNSNTLAKAALPSCLCQYQFYVDTKAKKLNLQIYIRSSDFFLANNWNTCTGAFFVHMLCNLNGIDLVPGKVIVVTGDTHIYKTHIEGVKENLKRFPRPLPKLEILKKCDSIEEFEWTDIKLIGYLPYPNIKAEMAV